MMYYQLSADDRKHLVKHYTNRARRLVEEHDFDQVRSCISKAREFAIGGEDDRIIAEATSAIKTTLSNWLAHRWSDFAVQIESFPISKEQRRLLRSDLHALVELDALEIFVDKAMHAAADAAKDRAFEQAISMLLNVIILIDDPARDIIGNKRIKKDVCTKIREFSESRRSAFELEEKRFQKLLNAPAKRFKDTDDCRALGRKWLQAMNNDSLSDNFYEAIAHLCNDGGASWLEHDENEQQKLEDYELRLGEKVGLIRKRDRFRDDKRQLQDLWATPLLLQDNYQLAKRITTQLLADYPGDDKAQAWDEEAEEHLEEAKKYVDGLCVRAGEGEFEPLITAYRLAMEEGYNELPWSEKMDDGYKVLADRLEPAMQALARVEALARAYADDEAERLFSLAKEALNKSAEKSRQLIDEAMVLPYLSSEKQAELSQFKQDVLENTFRTQKEVNRLLKEAEKLQKQEKILEAWQYTMKALQKSPDYAAALQQKQRLLPWARVHWKGAVRSASRSLQKGNLDTADRDAMKVVQHTDGVVEFRESFEEAKEILNAVASMRAQQEVSP